MKLVIVESPTKARTISQFLGSDFHVVSSYGHVRDLPKSKLGVDVEHDFTPQYVIPTKVRKRVNELKKDAHKAESVVLATDEDREGEAIAWHLVHALDLEGKNQKPPGAIVRIVFHEITPHAIEEALAHPREIDKQRVDAQQARRILDRLVGYNLSPFLWKKISRGLSAGRVQSVALRIIVEREREREQFKAQEYWTIAAAFKTSGVDFTAELVGRDGKTLGKFDIHNETTAKDIIEELNGADFVMAKVEERERKFNPNPPFRTSTLQQEAWKRLHFSAKQTMMFAQQLYEGIEIDGKSAGLITYMRTDSANLAQDFLTATRDYLQKELGSQYAQGSRHFAGKARGAQEAHEAIRPSDVTKTPELLKGKIPPRHWKLYDLVWRRAVASQMPPAVFRVKTVEVEATPKDPRAKKALFRANGSTVQFDGFLRVWPAKREESELPEVTRDQKISCQKLLPVQHFTEPPPRYSEASLVKTLEEAGIGRPSTYAPIISTIQDRGYVTRDQDRRLTPVELGVMVNDLLVEHFPEVVDIGFTAKMEKDLDEIAHGEKQWVPIIKEFYDPFSKHVAEKVEVVTPQKIEEPTEFFCERCAKPLVIKLGRFGRFMACTGFPECKFTKSLPEYSSGVICPLCNKGELTMRRSKRGKVFWGCSSYPECTNALWDKPNGKNCPDCASLVVVGKRDEERCSSKTCKWKAPTAIE